MMDIGSTGLLAPGRLRWLRALIWMVALAVVLVVGFNAVARATLWLLASDAPTAKLIAAVAGAIALLILYWLAIRLGERRPVAELSMRPAPAELLIGSVIGAALIGLIIVLQWLFGWVEIDPQPVSRIALAVRDSVRSGVLEEVLLRLVIFRLAWRALGIWPALAVSAALFGVLHLANPDSSLFAAIALAAGEGVGIGLYLITGRIWASIGMHAAWNFTQGWIFGAAVSGTTEIAGGPLSLRQASGVSDLLSGGGFGPEASLAALFVSLLASAAFLWWPWKRGRFVTADQTSGKDATAS